MARARVAVGGRPCVGGRVANRRAVPETTDVASSLFPDGCTCGHYGHGLTMTRVHMASCVVHDETPKAAEPQVCCIKYGPMADTRRGDTWCKCPPPRVQTCELDRNDDV